MNVNTAVLLVDLVLNCATVILYARLAYFCASSSVVPENIAYNPGFSIGGPSDAESLHQDTI